MTQNKFFIFLKRQDQYLLLPILSLIICLILILVPFLLLYQVLPDQLPLFYSLPWGEPQLIQKDQFFILPTILLLIGLINFSLIWQLHPQQIILKRILSLSIAALSLAGLITAIKILTIFN